MDITNLAQHELTLVVSKNTQSLENFCQELSAVSACKILNVGGRLSEAMLHLSQRQRSTFAARWLEDQIRSTADTILVLCNIDLLFDPALHLDPLALFTRCSRGRKLFVLWPGSYTQGILSYAVPEHGHYSAWKNPQVAIYPLKQFQYLP